MCRNSNTFCGSGTMFALFLLIFFYVATTALLLNVEGAQPLPSQRDIQEAQKIVGEFLRNEVGTAWLSELSETDSSPLTTPDLMNAILRVTKEGDAVWQAATTLLNVLNSPNAISSRMDLTSGQSDSWKDMIAKIEMEDDIICLYRKNSNETSKRAEDWKKFLKTVSPGYTVHVAIDTGRKYVICLKKIELPKTTSQAPSTTTEKPVTTTNISSAVPSETTSQLSTVEEQPPVSSASRNMKKLSTEIFPEKTDKHKVCKANAVRKMNDDGTVTDNDDATIGSFSHKNSAKNKYRLNQNRRDMGNYLNQGLPVRADYGCRASGTCKDVRDEPFHMPIIFVMLNPNDFSAYQRSPTIFPTNEGLRADSLWRPQKPRCTSKFKEYFHPNLYQSRRPTGFQRSREPYFDQNNPWQSISGHRPGASKNIYFRPQLLDRRTQNDVFARRTAQRFKQTSCPAPKANVVSSRRTDPGSLLLNRKQNIGTAIPSGNWVQLIPDKNRYKNPQIIVNHAGHRSAPVQHIYRSLETRPNQQPFVQRPKPWAHDKLPHRKVVGPREKFLSNASRPWIQNLDRKDLNSLAFWGSQLQSPCRNSRCMQTGRKPPYYMRPGPLLGHFNLGNPLNRVPLVYSESLLLNGNSGLGHVSNGVECPKPCEKPINLQVVINGKVKEPLDVSVLSQTGQKLDVVGSDHSMLAYEPETPVNRLPDPTRLPDNTNTYFETEINTRMDLQKLNTKEAALTESSITVNSTDSESEEHSTTQVNAEITSLESDILSDSGINSEGNLSQHPTTETIIAVQTDENTSTTTMSSTTIV